MNFSEIKRPPFRAVSLAEGQKWSGDNGWRFEEKMDGVWEVYELRLPIYDCRIVGERMISGEFYAFDLIGLQSTDMRERALWERLQALDEVLKIHRRDALCHSIKRPRFTTSDGAAFLAEILKNGGEGVVAKDLSAPFGSEWIKCKRAETFDLIVTAKDKNGGSSIHLVSIEGRIMGGASVAGSLIACAWAMWWRSRRTAGTRAGSCASRGL